MRRMSWRTSKETAGRAGDRAGIPSPEKPDLFWRRTTLLTGCVSLVRHRHGARVGAFAEPAQWDAILEIELHLLKADSLSLGHEQSDKNNRQHTEASEHIKDGRVPVRLHK